MAKRPGLHRSLHLQVLAAILLGVCVGAFWPAVGAALKPVGDAFVSLVKMIITPVIFLTVVTGIGGMRELGGLGRVVGKAFVYFLALSTLALVIGLVAALVVQPGAAMHVDPSTLDAKAVADYAAKAHDASVVAFLVAIIPTTLASALTEGSILQTLFIAVLFGIAMVLTGEAADPVQDILERVAAIVFRLTAILMRAAPIGAFGAMAFTIGKYGVASLISLAQLVACVYGTSALFVVIVLAVLIRRDGELGLATVA